MRRFYGKQQVWTKAVGEVVGEADIEAEQAALKEIRRRHPSDAILSEEAGRIAGDPERVWIIDPLDGTLKFILGEPYFSVSVAFEWRGSVEVGVIFNPFTREMYSARRGQGALKNGVRLHVSDIENVSQSFICCDWGPSARLRREGLRNLRRLSPPSVRAIGVNFSPALDLCRLAEGRILAMISNGTTSEDHAAGALIVQEAGGIVKNYDRTPWSHASTGILAAAGPGVFNQIVHLLWRS